MAVTMRVGARNHRRAPVSPVGHIAEGATLLDVFQDRVWQSAERCALRYEAAGSWHRISWAQYGQAVRDAAAGLMAFGLEPGDRVGILATNQPRWHMADLAVLSAAGVTVPAYPSSSASQVAHVLGHSGARMCVVGDGDQLAKVLLALKRLPALERVVILGQPPGGLDDELLVTFDELCARGRDLLAAGSGTLDMRTRSVDLDTLATIVYTSGTTGRPKGVMITHANLAETLRSLTEVVPIGPTDRFLSFLPLSHIAERVVSHFGQVAAGGETWFARSLATVAADLRSCRPTIFLAVPRVWEKTQAGVLERLEQAPRPVRALAERYVALGLERLAAHEAGLRRSPGDVVGYLMLDRWVGRRIRRALGFDHGRVFVSSAAPVNPGLLRWFHAIGIPIAEVYGLTEGCGPATMNRPGRIRVGTAGEPLPRVDVRIAPDGEVLLRGPTMCAGYHDDPAATQALLARGWLHSGDLGIVDDDGRLHITGRKKDLIVTSGGENIAPQDVETCLESEPLISQAVVVGDGRPYLTALLALDTEAVLTHIGQRNGDADPEVLGAHPAVREEVARAVERVNGGRAPIERIKAWRILPRDLTIVGGELTPTLKVRRDVVTGRFHELIDEMYAAPRPSR